MCNHTIEFPRVPPLKPGAACELRAMATSGLPVICEVDYGPVVVKDGKLRVADLPTRPQLPVECSVTACQIGRRAEPAVRPDPPVSQVLRVVAG